MSCVCVFAGAVFPGYGQCVRGHLLPMRLPPVDGVGAHHLRHQHHGPVRQLLLSRLHLRQASGGRGEEATGRRRRRQEGRWREGGEAQGQVSQSPVEARTE